MPPNGKYHLSHFTCKTVRHTYGQRISVQKNSMKKVSCPYAGEVSTITVVYILSSIFMNIDWELNPKFS